MAYKLDRNPPKPLAPNIRIDAIAENAPLNASSPGTRRDRIIEKWDVVMEGRKFVRVEKQRLSRGVWMWEERSLAEEGCVCDV